MYNLRKDKRRSWCFSRNRYATRVYKNGKFAFNAEDAIEDLLWWYWVYRRNPASTPWFQYESQELIDLCDLPLKREGSHWVATGDVVAALVPLIDYLHGGLFWNSFSTDGTGALAFEDRGEPQRG